MCVVHSFHITEMCGWHMLHFTCLFLLCSIEKKLKADKSILSAYKHFFFFICTFTRCERKSFSTIIVYTYYKQVPKPCYLPSSIAIVVLNNNYNVCITFVPSIIHILDKKVWCNCNNTFCNFDDRARSLCLPTGSNPTCPPLACTNSKYISKCLSK